MVRVRVGGGGGARMCERQFRKQEAYTAPSDMEVRGQAEQDDQSNVTAVHVCLCHPCSNNHK